MPILVPAAAVILEVQVLAVMAWFKGLLDDFFNCYYCYFLLTISLEKVIKKIKNEFNWSKKKSKSSDRMQLYFDDYH